MTNEQLAGAMIDLARREFYYYCRFRMPKVYRDDRPHLRKLCNDLQEFIEGPETGLIINMPPRHGKTLSAELLVEWYLGKNPESGIIAACYNELLSSRFSKAVRGGIEEKSATINRPVFSDYFPGVKIKDGDGAVQLWALNDSHFSFLATSPGGTATGIGCQLMIIDDLIKNAEEAYNERVLENHWEWYNNTMLSRLERGAKQIIIQTRWSTGDVSGRLLIQEPDKWRLIKVQAQNPDGSMLCESMLSRDRFEDLKKTMDPVILAGNYQQEPFDSVDKLYPEFKTYAAADLPPGGTIESYVDTADEGKDYLAGAVYKVFKNTAYVLDVVYTQEPMEKTEGMVARMLANNSARKAHIESNNGGKGFARNVERIMRENLQYTGCEVISFHQADNKIARITSKSTNVVNTVIMPSDWEKRWPQFAQDVKRMSRVNKWTHDDCADMLTGIYEKSCTVKPAVQNVYVPPMAHKWG